MRKLLIILLFVSSETFAQNITCIEQSIDSLFWCSKSPEKILEVAKLIKWQSNIIKNIPSIPPVMPHSFSKIYTSSNFGYRIHPISQTTHIHPGIDLPSVGNDTIYAPANGVIDTIGYNDKLGYYITIQHKYNFKSIYGHLSAVLIYPHQTINIGHPVAIMGSTGSSTGKHLHYTIKHNNQYVPPLPFCYLLFYIISVH